MKNRLLFALATVIGSAMQLAPSAAQQPARASGTWVLKALRTRAVFADAPADAR